MKKLVLLLMLLFTPVPPNAQVVAQASGSYRVVTLSLKNVSMREALESVSKQSGVAIWIGEPALGSNQRVSVSVKQIPAREAVDKILQGTGFRSEISPVGDILILRGKTTTNIKRGQGIIAGKVIDAKSGRGISGVTISANDSHRVASADDGTYRLALLPEGTYTVTARLVGYAKQSRSVTVAEGATVTVDFKLEPSANVLDQVVVTGTVVQTELRAVPNAITVVTAREIEERGITKIDQLFRGDIPGLFSINIGSSEALDAVTMFSRGATALGSSSAGTSNGTNPIKTYIDGVEMADPKYLSQIDPKSIERIEILTGPQASTIYGSNAINGVMQIFTKRGKNATPNISLGATAGVAQNDFNNSLAPDYLTDVNIAGMEGKWSYSTGGSWNYIGSWTPSKQTQRAAINGGGRMELSKVTADVSGRRGWTQNRQRGDRDGHVIADLQASGRWIYGAFSSPAGVAVLQNSVLNGQTFGVTLGFRPRSWWSQEAVFGTDASTTETVRTAAIYTTRADSSPSIGATVTSRRSERYTNTLQIPMSSIIHVNLVAGGDHWRTGGSSWSASPQSLTGTLTGISFLNRNKPGKNSGAFVQGQLSLADALFITYGVRADWNPNFGDKARVKPGRYGISYARDFGMVSAKLRGSYGRSIRPPGVGLKDAAIPQTTPSVVNQFGAFNLILANPYLGPEHQQGGEGGMEIYVGNRGSLSVTRYNQTVDNLISIVNHVDSIRAISPGEADGLCGSTYRDANGYCYQYQSQYLNAASIRNQGWETRGILNFGAFSAHGTYSWVKSRVLSVTPVYRSLLTGSGFEAFQPGRSFDFNPEHVWALGLKYSDLLNTVSLFLNGRGMLYLQQDEVAINSSSNNRLQLNRTRMSLTGYRSLTQGSATADLNVVRNFSASVAASLQITNLTNYYQNEFNGFYPTLGRQSRVGLRMRL